MPTPPWPDHWAAAWRCRPRQPVRLTAWTELLGVSPVSQSQWWGMRAARKHPTTDLPKSATNAAGVTSQGGDRTAMGGSEASGPWGLLPRGRTRTGLEVEMTTRSTGPMVTHGKCSGRAH
jgi:hypothetical protein